MVSKAAKAALFSGVVFSGVGGFPGQPQPSLGRTPKGSCASRARSSSALSGNPLVSRGDKRALFKRTLCSLPDVWPSDWCLARPPHPSLPCLLAPPPLSVASAQSQLKWADTNTEKGQLAR